MKGSKGASPATEAMNQAVGGVSAAEAALIGAGIAAAVSILTLLANAWIQRRAARADAITKQIDQLYGPLRVLNIQSKSLATKLRQGKPDVGNWKLLDHLTEVADDAADRVIAQQIIRLNEQIEKILYEHAGLIEGADIPGSFENFLSHTSFLKIAFEAADGSRDDPVKRQEMTRHFSAKESEYFPRQFDEDVESAIEALHEKRQKLLNR